MVLPSEPTLVPSWDMRHPFSLSLSSSCRIFSRRWSWRRLDEAWLRSNLQEACPIRSVISDCKSIHASHGYVAFFIPSPEWRQTKGTAFSGAMKADPLLSEEARPKTLHTYCESGCSLCKRIAPQIPIKSCTSVHKLPALNFHILEKSLHHPIYAPHDLKIGGLLL